MVVTVDLLDQDADTIMFQTYQGLHGNIACRLEKMQYDLSTRRNAHALPSAPSLRG
jgi:hypothetical protein